LAGHEVWASFSDRLTVATQFCEKREATAMTRDRRPLPYVLIWLLPVLPLISYGGCLGFMAYDLLGLPDFYPPFIASGQESAAQFFLLCSIAIAVLLLYVAFRTFRFLTKSQHIPRKTIAQKLAAYSVSALGLAPALLHFALPAFPYGSGPTRAALLQVGALFALSLFLTASSVLFAAARHARSDWQIWAFDAAAFLLEFAYAVLALIAANAMAHFAFAAALGYPLLVLVFARIPIHFRQMLGAQFPLPWEAPKKSFS
jgi:hypothetical protein